MTNGESIAIVSSNNSATKNVYEKLEKNGLEFIAALLGNTQNKKEFIDSQKEIPDLSPFDLTDTEKSAIKAVILDLDHQISENLQKKNELASLQLEVESLKTEYAHFKMEHTDIINTSFKKNITADKILDLWVHLETLEKK